MKVNPVTDNAVPSERFASFAETFVPPRHLMGSTGVSYAFTFTEILIIIFCVPPQPGYVICFDLYLL